jgi:hypothetical protein
MDYISIRPLVNYLANSLPSKALIPIVIVPVCLAGMRLFVFNLLGVCGLPIKASFTVSDLVLFFVAALIVFSLIDGCISVPELVGDNALDGFIETVRCTGLY